METLDNEFTRFGRTVAEVMRHHGSADDVALDANLGFVLLDKEERKGLASFSQAERHDLEDEFYDNPEDLDAMILRFIAARPGEFSS